MLAGVLTLPKSRLVESVFSEAPLPMNRSAPVTEIPSRSPLSTPPGTVSGSRIPLTSERLTSMVAEPKTTSAMLRPTLPPMRKVGSVGPRATSTPATGACLQSST